MVERLNVGLGGESPRLAIKLRTCGHCRLRVVRASGVILVSKRETTQRHVKVPKFQLSVMQTASTVRDNQEVGLEAATLQRVRNRSLVEIVGLENGRGYAGHRDMTAPKGDRVGGRSAWVEAGP